MFCVSCGAKLPDGAKFCAACGSPIHGQPVEVKTVIPEIKQNLTIAQPIHEKPHVIDQELRKKLLAYFLEISTSSELSEWLQDLSQDTKGTPEEKVARIRTNTKFLTLPPEKFLEDILHQLPIYGAEHLSDICEDLKINAEGSKNILLKRIYREVGYREGWLKRFSEGDIINKSTVLPFVKWYPILKEYDYEKDYYDDFLDEMSEVFGENNVHEQLAVAHGTTLKIDFHIGHPSQGGVGVEFKVPTNNSELQKALGQIDQYTIRYGSELIIVLFPHFLDKAQQQLFIDEMNRKKIDTIIKQKIS